MLDINSVNNKMKKITISIIILAIIFGGFWLMKKDSETSLEKTTITYKNPSLGISFNYPKILTISSTEKIVTLHHEVPFSHHDYCDFRGEINTIVDTLTDFNVRFHLQNKNLVETMRGFSPYIPQENFVNNLVIESPGFIDELKIGNLRGYKIFEGAEGCEQTTYYFHISKNKTLVVEEELVTVFTGAIDVESEMKAKAVPGVINKEESTKIFELIMKTLQVQ